MVKLTQKDLKWLIRDGYAIDITTDDSVVNEPLRQIGYSAGKYGINGAYFLGIKSAKNYAIIGRTKNLFKYC